MKSFFYCSGSAEGRKLFDPYIPSWYGRVSFELERELNMTFESIAFVSLFLLASFFAWIHGRNLAIKKRDERDREWSEALGYQADAADGLTKFFRSSFPKLYTERELLPADHPLYHQDVIRVSYARAAILTIVIDGRAGDKSIRVENTGGYFPLAVSGNSAVQYGHSAQWHNIAVNLGRLLPLAITKLEMAPEAVPMGQTGGSLV
jgi:hypothetical protein